MERENKPAHQPTMNTQPIVLTATKTYSKPDHDPHGEINAHVATAYECALCGSEIPVTDETAMYVSREQDRDPNRPIVCNDCDRNGEYIDSLTPADWGTIETTSPMYATVPVPMILCANEEDAAEIARDRMSDELGVDFGALTVKGVTADLEGAEHFIAKVCYNPAPMQRSL